MAWCGEASVGKQGWDPAVSDAVRQTPAGLMPCFSQPVTEVSLDKTLKHFVLLPAAHPNAHTARLLVQKGLMSLDELRRATEALPGGCA
jgi:hypothetical protein